jgi:hypothetical protein
MPFSYQRKDIEPRRNPCTQGEALILFSLTKSEFLPYHNSFFFLPGPGGPRQDLRQPALIVPAPDHPRQAASPRENMFSANQGTTP